MLNGKQKCLITKVVCPESTACPCWAEILQQNIRTGEERITKNCLFRLLPEMMVEVIKASNRPAEQINRMQSGIERAVVQLATTTMEQIEHATDDH